VAAEEIEDRVPGAEGVEVAAREVRFRVPDLDAGLIGLRTVDDVFLEVGRVPSVGHTRDAPPALAHGVADLAWSDALAALRGARPVQPGAPFDVVASLEGRHNYSRFAVEDVVGRTLEPVLAGRHLARPKDGHPGRGAPPLTVRVFVRGGEARVALRIAATPLHRRGYKQAAGPGSLHPPLAAALVRLVGPAGVLADPFCGDGTITIEAAFARPVARILAGDIDAARLANARDNSTRAGAESLLSRMDAGLAPWAAGVVGAVVTNPPWGVGVDARGALAATMGPFWSELERVLTPDGRACLVADAALDVPGLLPGFGFHAGLATRVRLAGRVAHVVLCAPADRDCPRLPARLDEWRRRAIGAGVVTDGGF
jgi:23S rRNA G2445 N2-methylase RlmL